MESRWTRQQVNAVRNEAQNHLRQWQVYSAGLGGFGEDCQPLITLNVLQVLPALVSWSAAIPAGLLEVHSWLTPSRAAATDAPIATPPR